MRHLATILALLAGCAAPPPAPEPRPPAAPFVLVRTAPAEGGVDVADILAEPPARERWVVVEGPGAGTTIEVRLEPTDRFGAAIARTVEGDAIDYRSTRTGGTALHATLSIPDAAISLFAPPLPLLPPRLEAGAEFRGETAMEVVEESDPARRKDRGRGERVVRYAADADIELFGEPLRAKVIESTFTARLGTARATRTAELFVVPGRGAVAERWKREVLVLGLVRTVREGLRVRDPRASPTLGVP